MMIKKTERESKEKVKNTGLTKSGSNKKLAKVAKKLTPKA